MKLRLREGVLALGVVLAACRRPPPPGDPDNDAYHDAVVLFAQASKDSGDLTFRDARFDLVLAKLEQISPTSEARPKAQALMTRIRQARFEAEQQERATEALRRDAEQAPSFHPEPRLPPPTTVAAGRAEPPVAGAAVAQSGFAPAAAGVAQPFDPLKPRALPSWYQRRDEYGRVVGQGAGDSGSAEPNAVEAPSEAPAEPAAETAAPPVRTPTRPPPDNPDAPPAVFGLPGPANRALGAPP